jgi:hypothetical protein
MSVSVGNQKPLFKGGKASAESDHTLEAFQLKNGTRVQMLGSTVEDIGGLMAMEDEEKRAEQVQRSRETQVRVRQVNSPSLENQSADCNVSRRRVLIRADPKLRLECQHRFHNIQPLERPDSTRLALAKLTDDGVILHAMCSHRFSVGFLTELTPHENPGLLALNVNRGQAIKLCICTNLYDGSRSYKDIRRALCHELSHSVWTTTTTK